MPSCVMKTCHNSSRNTGKSSGVTFHRIPQTDPEKFKWESIIKKERGEQFWVQSQASRVCSSHFAPDCFYVTEKGYRKLKNQSVPSLSEVVCGEITESSSPRSLQDVDVTAELESLTATPRKVALKRQLNLKSCKIRSLIKVNNNLRKRNKRLVKKCNSLKSAILQLKKKLKLPEDQFQEVLGKAELYDLYERQLSKNKKQKFTPSLRKFAMTLNFYSPSAYRYVRQKFNKILPHPRTLTKWHESTTAEPGFTAEAFRVLKKKYISSGKKIICSLMFDEMAIRLDTCWMGSSKGLVDIGNGPCESAGVATQVLVLMVVCTNENWKLPVGYFFINGITGALKAKLVLTCLEKCWDVGVDIIALIFDGCESNISAMKTLGCELHDPENLKTTFQHPTCQRKVAIFFDPCHMIKLVRNHFESKKIIFDEDGKEIRWQHIINLVKLQNSETLRFGNRLTPKHIDFRHQIMKVHLATQVLSRSVAQSLRLCEELLVSSKFIETSPTVKFIEIFNDLFDVMNSNMRHNIGYKRPLCDENINEVLQFLCEVKKYILGLKIYCKTRRTLRRKVTMTITKKNILETKCKTGFLGFLVCIESIKHVFQSMVVQEKSLKYISMYRLSQDHLELFFGIIRRHGGLNNNPNYKQFKGIYRKVLGHLELRSSFSGNCIPFEDFIILTCSSALSTINNTSSRCIGGFNEANNEYSISDIYENEQNVKTKKFSWQKIKNRLEKGHSKIEIDQAASCSLQSVSALLINNSNNIAAGTEQIVGYISGWVARSLIKSLMCEECAMSLMTSTKHFFHKLISIKDMGGLCYPSADVFEICLKCENFIRFHIKAKENIYFTKEEVCKLKLKVIKSFINSNVLQSLLEHSLQQTSTFNHRVLLLKAVVDKYFNVKLHFLHKSNPLISHKTKRQFRNKLCLFEGK